MEQLYEVVELARQRLQILDRLVESGLEISIPADTIDIPPGRFVAVASGQWHSCGIRADKTIECWMDDAARLAVGNFHQISLDSIAEITAADPELMVQVLSDESLELSQESLQLLEEVLDGANAEEFNVALVGVEAARETISRRLTPPPGQFTALSVGGAHSCGLRTDGTIACWGDNDMGELFAPSGQFTAVSSGAFHSCGLRVDGIIECWGEAASFQWEIPPGQFVDVTSGSLHSCGLRVDGTVACWPELMARAPTTGDFIYISAGGAGQTCGVHSDTTVECWPDANPELAEEVSFIGNPGDGPAVFVTTNGLGSPVQISRSGDRYISVAWSPDGTRVVVNFPAAEDDYGNVIESPDHGLFVVDSAGNELWRITLTGDSPSWSPDGMRIAYDDNDGVWRGDQGGFAVYTVNADGMGARMPIGEWRGGTGPVWSPNGTQIMFRSPTGPFSAGLAVAGLDGGEAWLIDEYCEESQDPDDWYPQCQYQTGVWSPNGQEIAYTYGDDIHVVHSDGSRTRRLVSGGEDPNWSPDGQWMAYISTSSAEEASSDEPRQLWVVETAGGMSEFVADIQPWSAFVWSPDSTQLAYVAGSGTSAGVIMVEAPTSNSSPVPVSPPNSSSPAWSQDSSRIAFSSRGDAQLNPEGDTEIFVVRADGTNLIQVTDNAHDDYRPVWVASDRSPWLVN